MKRPYPTDPPPLTPNPYPRDAIVFDEPNIATDEEIAREVKRRRRREFYERAFDFRHRPLNKHGIPILD